MARRKQQATPANRKEQLPPRTVVELPTNTTLNLGNTNVAANVREMYAAAEEFIAQGRLSVIDLAILAKMYSSPQ